MATFAVKVTNRNLIKASNPCHKHQILLPVSNIDLIQSRGPAALIYIYPKQPTASFSTITTTIKQHLPEFLNHFYPFAGRISKNLVTGRPEILCSNEGAELVEAHADTKLFDLDFSDVKKSLELIMLSFASDIPLCLQVICFNCGGFAINWCSNHLIVDAYSLSKFSSSWKELLQTKKIMRSPNFNRAFFLPREPRRFNPTVDHIFTTCSPDDLVNILSGALFKLGLYYVAASDIYHLQAMATQNRHRATRLEAFSAHVWKVLAEVVGESDTACKMGWYVNSRQRMGSAHVAAMETYIGNGHSAVSKEASVKDIKAASLSEVAEIVNSAIKEVANADHFLDLVNWVECHDKESIMLPKACLGLGSPVIYISSCHHLEMESDFGFGKALLGCFHSQGSDRLAIGFMNLASSPQGDGSWIVNADLWPQVALALESNPECPLRPITASLFRELVRGGGDQGLSSRL